MRDADQESRSGNIGAVKATRCTVLACFLFAVTDAAADNLLDWVRSYDMNDYSLGVAVAARQNPYIGGENGGEATVDAFFSHVT